MKLTETKIRNGDYREALKTGKYIHVYDTEKRRVNLMKKDTSLPSGLKDRIVNVDKIYRKIWKPEEKDHGPTR